MKRVRIFTVLAALIIAISSCKQKNGSNSGEPGNFELYKLFDKQLGQTAKAGGYVNYKVKLDRIQKLSECDIPEGGTTTCYPYKIDRTEYLTGYHKTYVSKYVDDEYKIYRGSDGKLNILNHQPGKTKTVERKNGGM